MSDRHVDPSSNCIRFDRVDWSLIEEPDVCELCRYYNEEHSTCCCPEQPT